MNNIALHHEEINIYIAAYKNLMVVIFCDSKIKNFKMLEEISKDI